MVRIGYSQRRDAGELKVSLNDTRWTMNHVEYNEQSWPKVGRIKWNKPGWDSKIGGRCLTRPWGPYLYLQDVVEQLMLASCPLGFSWLLLEDSVWCVHLAKHELRHYRCFGLKPWFWSRGYINSLLGILMESYEFWTYWL